MESDFSHTLTGGRADFPHVLDAIEAELAARGVPPAAIGPVLIASDEVVSNILDHGGGDGRSPRVEIGVSVRDGAVTVQIDDDGPAFDPTRAAAPDTGLSVEDRQVGGLGIHLVRKLMDAVGYDRIDGRNRLRFSKSYAQPPVAAP